MELLPITTTNLSLTPTYWFVKNRLSAVIVRMVLRRILF